MGTWSQFIRKPTMKSSLNIRSTNRGAIEGVENIVLTKQNDFKKVVLANPTLLSGLRSIDWIIESFKSDIQFLDALAHHEKTPTKVKSLATNILWKEFVCVKNEINKPEIKTFSKCHLTMVH